MSGLLGSVMSGGFSAHLAACSRSGSCCPWSSWWIDRWVAPSAVADRREEECVNHAISEIWRKYFSLSDDASVPIHARPFVTVWRATPALTAL